MKCSRINSTHSQYCVVLLFILLLLIDSILHLCFARHLNYSYNVVHWQINILYSAFSSIELRIIDIYRDLKTALPLFPLLPFVLPHTHTSIPFFLLSLRLITGVAVSSAVNIGSRIMMTTAVSYVIIQIPGILYLHSSAEDQQSGVVAYAFITLVLCISFFLAYLYYQFTLSGTNEVEERVREDVMIDAINTVKTCNIHIHRLLHF